MEKRGLFYIHNSFRQVAPTGLIDVNDHYPYKQVALTGLSAA